MKTAKEIYTEWLTKDGMGVRYTDADRMINAMLEWEEQQVKVFSSNLFVSGLLPLDKVNRVEVIDEKGRSYVKWDDNNKAELSFQDDGRTLKVFVVKRQ